MFQLKGLSKFNSVQVSKECSSSRHYNFTSMCFNLRVKRFHHPQNLTFDSVEAAYERPTSRHYSFHLPHEYMSVSVIMGWPIIRRIFSQALVSLSTSEHQDSPWYIVCFGAIRRGFLVDFRRWAAVDVFLTSSSSYVARRRTILRGFFGFGYTVLTILEEDTFILSATRGGEEGAYITSTRAQTLPGCSRDVTVRPTVLVVAIALNLVVLFFAGEPF